jgi:hypothetical protein
MCNLFFDLIRIVKSLDHLPQTPVCHAREFCNPIRPAARTYYKQ